MLAIFPKILPNLFPCPFFKFINFVHFTKLRENASEGGAIYAVNGQQGRIEMKLLNDIEIYAYMH